MEPVEVKAQDVRLPARAMEALNDGEPVAVTRYGRRALVLLSDEQFSLVEPLLEMLVKGATISPEMLMSEEDIELIRDFAEDREPAEPEEAQLEALIAAELGDGD
jgi:PHD/YefM family antitoxin component YafN of YafNO toxin-antitoxin module